MLTGTASLDELDTHSATLVSFDTDALTLPGTAVVQALFEMRHTGRQSSLPAGLHPTNPPTFILQFWDCPDSPWGPFRLAQGRVGCRSGLRPRGLVQGCVCDNAAAAAALRERWGYPVRPGEVSVQRRYDAVSASASVDGTVVASLRAFDPEPLGVGDIAYTTTLALAHTPRGARLVQIDVDVEPSRAERVRPELDAFVASAWVHPSIDPYHPVSASVAIGDLTIQRLRFVSKPDELAFTGTETLERKT